MFYESDTLRHSEQECKQCCFIRFYPGGPGILSMRHCRGFLWIEVTDDFSSSFFVLVAGQLCVVRISSSFKYLATTFAGNANRFRSVKIRMEKR